MQFKLKSKLSPTKYPCLQTMNEILQWLTFAPNVDPYDIDPVLLGRLAHMAKDDNRKHYIISGSRSTKRQEQIWLEKGGVKNADGTYSDPYKKINGRVAKPNTSVHEFKLAVDSGDKFYKSLEANESTANQIKWKKYGLFKPLTSGNGMKKACENWHLQVLESNGQNLEWRKKFMPTPIESKPTPQKKSAIDILVDKNIISSPKYWVENSTTNNFINGNFARQLILNFGHHVLKTTDYEKCLEYLYDNELINSIDFWRNKTDIDNKVEGQYMMILIERMAERL